MTTCLCSFCGFPIYFTDLRSITGRRIPLNLDGSLHNFEHLAYNFEKYQEDALIEYNDAIELVEKEQREQRENEKAVLEELVQEEQLRC